MKPLGRMVLVRPITQEQKLEGGLVMPESYRQDRPDTGKVIAKGPKALDVKKGETIYFNRFAGEGLKYKGEELILVNQEDVYAII